MRKFVVVACALALLAGCEFLKPKPGPEGRGIVQTPGDKMRGENYYHMEQGWTDADRERFYHLSQGSRMMPYDWFLVLERPGSKEMFADNAYLVDRMQFLPGAKGKGNPDSLPIGFARDRERWLGLTCAACHTGMIEREGVKVIVDGAPGMYDLTRFLTALTAALKETHDDDGKFARFAEALQRRTRTPVNVNTLKAELANIILLREGWQRRNATASHYGFGRTDAFGIIPNQVGAMGIPAFDAPPVGDGRNVHEPDAPVSYPHLWDIAQDSYAFLQWNGIASNNVPVVGALSRNAGEVLGVFGKVYLEPSRRGYKNTVQIGNLIWIENNIKNLVRPQWEPLAPAVDQTKAAEGEKLFDEYCAGCHYKMNPTDRHRQMKACMEPLASIGTDPTMARNFAENMIQTGPLEGTPAQVAFGPPLPAEVQAGGALGNAVLGSILGSLTRTPLKGATDNPNGLAVSPVGGDGNGDDGRDPLAQIKAATEDEIFKLVADDAGKIEDLLKQLTGDNALYRTSGLGGDQTDDWSGAGACKEEVNPLAYKSRPMDGVWATGPFLHNGSVPTLWQLFKKPEERVKKFRVGNRVLDVREVGFVYDLAEGGDVYDTTLPGNGNGGHGYGTTLSDADKWAIIEFMKSY